MYRSPIISGDQDPLILSRHDVNRFVGFLRLSKQSRQLHFSSSHSSHPFPCAFIIHKVLVFQDTVNSLCRQPSRKDSGATCNSKCEITQTSARILDRRRVNKCGSMQSARSIARHRSNGISVRYRWLATAVCLNVRRHAAYL